ncbi:MAG: cache domain-containing protein, partial [Defluviitaleaceae bacterium]|nr:cache domain-containing protein [Defluviitaleaceae bacterium]
MKKIAGIRTKTTIYILTPVIISFIVVGLVLFFSLFNSQQKFATLQFQNIASKYAANFEKKINVALDYLSTVANVLEFQIHESDVDREALQRMMYYVFDGHTVNSSSIYFEPDAYDGKDAQYINTMFGTSLSGRISYYFYRYNGRTGYRHEALENDIEFTLPFYTETKKTGAPVYSEPVILNIDGEDILMFIITYPIFRNNEFIGVITADIFLEEIYAELQAEKIFETGYVIIANDKQNLIYSPRFEDIGMTREQAGFSYSL